MRFLEPDATEAEGAQLHDVMVNPNVRRQQLGLYQRRVGIHQHHP